jgi:small subunit ribosomal protein S20
MAKRTKSAIKRVRSSQKRRSRNLLAKQGIKKILKAADKAISSKAADVTEILRKAVSLIDKAVERGIIPMNRAARKKSRLILKYNKGKA